MITHYHIKTELITAVRITDPQDTPMTSHSGHYLNTPAEIPAREATRCCPSVIQVQTNLGRKREPYPNPCSKWA